MEPLTIPPFSMINNPTVIVLIFTATILFFSILYNVLTKNRRSKSLEPPKVAGAWPLLGHLPLFRSVQPPHITLASLADKYGSIFTMKMGVFETLVISSSDLAKQCFTSYDVSISDRPEFAAAKHLSYNYAIFGLAPYGPYWRQLRKITTLELLSNRRVGLLKHVRDSEIGISLKHMYKSWSGRDNGSSHGSVEMKRWFENLNFNVILRIVCGKRLDVGDREASCQKLFREFFSFMQTATVRDVIPCLGWMDLGGQERAMKKIAKDLDGILSRWLDEHKKKKEKQRGLDVCEGESDFMGILMSILDETSLDGCDFDKDTVIKATSLSMMIGGTDTTTYTLTWALSLILNNPDALNKVKDELDNVVGNGRLVSESDINKLVYLQAVVKETLRLYPFGSMLFREFSKDCTVSDYHVRKGTRLIVNTKKIQRDPKTWSDPLEFRPERFLSSHKDVDLRGKDFELLPFGAGRRVCAGLSFALQMTQCTLASLLHAFEISTSSGFVDMTESCGFIGIKSTPLEVLVKPRLSLHLYE